MCSCKIRGHAKSRVTHDRVSYGFQCIFYFYATHANVGISDRAYHFTILFYVLFLQVFVHKDLARENANI